MGSCSSICISLFTFAQLFSFVQGWGSNAIPNSLRPYKSYENKFPSTPTVVVNGGQSASQAINEVCDTKVGKSGYCTVQLVGNPSDETINIARSRTKLTSNGAEITSSGAVTFVALTKRDLKYVIVEDLNIKGHTAKEVFGIFVTGSGISGVIIRNNNIYGFNGLDGAHGIAVYGTGDLSITDVSIDSNEVYDMKTGFSESIVVNGNVEKWEIINNYVHDVDNIAIDAIGGEGTVRPSENAKLPKSNDAARGGFIKYNTVERMSTRNNPQYDGAEWAAGIYVDGGRQVHIEGNTIRDCPWGIEIGAENCVISSDVIVKWNEVSGSEFGDFLAGGYSEGGYLENSYECNPLKTKDSEEGHGYVQRITVTDNEFLTSDGKEDNVLVQFRTTFAIIKQDGVSPVNANGDGSATGDDNAIKTI